MQLGNGREQKVALTNSLLAKIILTFSVLLILILSAVYFSFNTYFARSYRDNRCFFNQMSMETTAEAVEDFMHRLRQDMERVFEKPSINHLTAAGRDYADADRIAATQELKQWKESVAEGREAALLVPDSGLVVRSDRSVIPLEGYEGRERMEQLLEDGDSVGLAVVQDEALFLSAGYPEARPLAILQAEVDTGILYDIVQNRTDHATSWPLYIYDRNRSPVFAGELEYPSFPSEELLTESEGTGWQCFLLRDDSSVLVMKHYSPELGWYFISCLPENGMTVPGIQILSRIIPVLLFLLVLISVVLLVMIFQVYSPLRRLMRIVEDGTSRRPPDWDGKGSELEYIQGIVEQDKKEKEQMKTLLDASSGEIAGKMIGMLVRKHTEQSEDWYGILQQMEHSITEPGKFVLLLYGCRVLKADAGSSARYHARDTIMDYWKKRCDAYPFTVGEDAQGIVLRYPSQTLPSSIRRDLTLFDSFLKANPPRTYRLAWGWGPAVPDFRQICDTWEEAEQAMKREREEALNEIPELELSADRAGSDQIRYVELAKEYIADHYSDSSLSLDMVSEELGISSPYLSSLMTKYLSVGFAEYLSRYRMSQARRLLENSELSITEVGERTGFSSIQNFGRVFKKYNGESAGSYRKKMKEQQPEDSEDGETGKDSENGKDSETGKGGETGKDGETGENGKDGENGENGEEGEENE